MLYTSGEPEGQTLLARLGSQVKVRILGAQIVRALDSVLDAMSVIAEPIVTMFACK
jgi:hypothetical protein